MATATVEQPKAAEAKVQGAVQPQVAVQAPTKPKVKRYRQYLVRGPYVGNDPSGRMIPDPNGVNRDPKTGTVRMVPADFTYYDQQQIERRGGVADGPTIVESEVDLAAAFPDKFVYIHTSAGFDMERQAGETKAQFAARLRAMADDVMQTSDADEDVNSTSDRVLDSMRDEELRKLGREEGVDLSKCRDRAQMLATIRHSRNS